MARFLAEMDTTFQLLATGKTTGNLVAPAGLVLKRFLATGTWLFDQVWASRTAFSVFMTLVFDFLMTAGWSTGAFVVARWRACTTGLRRM
jgi:hypothetical protein